MSAYELCTFNNEEDHDFLNLQNFSLSALKRASKVSQFLAAKVVALLTACKDTYKWNFENL